MDGLAAWLVLGLALGANGCVSYCDRVADFERQWAARPASDAPEMAIAVPYPLVDRLMAARTAEIDPVELALGDRLGLVAKLLRFEVKVASVRARHADDEHVGFAIDLDFRAAGESWLVTHLDARATPRIDGRAVSIGLDASDLEALEPRLGDDAKAHLAEMLRLFLPRIVSDRLDEAAIADAASELGAFLVGEGYRQIRHTLLARLGQVAELRVALPELPVKAIHTRSKDGPVPHFLVEVVTERSAGAALGPVEPAADRIRARIAGPALAEIGNWEVARGRLPGRYDDAMRPDPAGKLRPLFDWREGAARPLVIHVLCTDGPCFRLRVAAKARAALDGESLRFDVEDGAIEAVDGSWLTELGVWWKRLGEGPIEASRGEVAHTSIELFGRPLRLRATDAALDERGLLLGLDASW